MLTVHFIYPHGRSISCPDAIGRKVGSRLASRYRIVQYDWDDFRVIQPGPNDVLLGHPHPFPWTIFRRSLKQPGWRRAIALSPYHHGDHVQVAFLDTIMTRCDLYLAITGNYWSESVKESLFSHWLPKMVFLDLAVDRQDFPIVKKKFNPPSERRFLYIGQSGWPKNTDYLGSIARMMPGVEFTWVGSGRNPIAGFTSLGFQDFSLEQGKKTIADHDFLITVGMADANPATILEAMAWGLIPVCTPQSGYAGYSGIVNVQPNDVQRVVKVLRQLEHLPDRELKAMQTANWVALESHFNWERFTEQIIEAIESDECPEIGARGPSAKLKIICGRLLSPYSPLRPTRFMRYAKGSFRHWLKV
jgi:glycosyltransferase involved in cell wall biosynthesis